MDELTERERTVFTACQRYIADHKFSPAIRDIMELTRINSTSLVRYYLGSLERKGYIRLNPGLSRAIVILEKL
jgi:SOS-response transcriptional repressor LexA